MKRLAALLLLGLASASRAADDGTLPGVAANLASGRLRALALTTSSYATGESVTWFQGDTVEPWERRHRRGARTALTVDHVAASAALPFLFPPVRLAVRVGVDVRVRVCVRVGVGVREAVAVKVRVRVGV